MRNLQQKQQQFVVIPVEGPINQAIIYTCMYVHITPSISTKQKTEKIMTSGHKCNNQQFSLIVCVYEFENVFGCVYVLFPIRNCSFICVNSQMVIKFTKKRKI